MRIPSRRMLRAAARQGSAVALAISAGGAQGPPLRTISSVPTCAQCRISLESQATLRLPSDSLSFAYGIRVGRLANGHFLAWGLNETPSPVLFDATRAEGRIDVDQPAAGRREYWGDRRF